MATSKLQAPQATTGVSGTADSAAATPSTAATDTCSRSRVPFETDGNDSLKARLEIAAAGVYNNKEAADRLFSQWRVSLLRLSYLVILITLHQVQAPVTECIKNIKV